MINFWYVYLKICATENKRDKKGKLEFFVVVIIKIYYTGLYKTNYRR